MRRMDAVTRLRRRGCWAEAAALLAPAATVDFAAALERAEVLVEAAFFTLAGWAEAESAVTSAEALAGTDEQRGAAALAGTLAGTGEQRGAAALARGYLAYAGLLREDRATAATAAEHYATADTLLAPDSPHRPVLDFRRGLVVQVFEEDPAAARRWFDRAHAGADGDELLLSFTWRHRAAVDAAEGQVAAARHGFTESLRLRERCGFVVGLAPALHSLASVTDEPEATRLRAEAARLVRSFNGTPAWLPADADG
jgi:hypothetical protein